HDFNNLLQAVMGNLELIDTRADDAEGVHKWSRNARQAVERGRKLTGQLLAFSRVQAMEVNAFCLAPMFEETQELIGKSVGPLARLDREIPERELSVFAARTQLQLALLNLAINARDAMPDGGTIGIHTGTASGKVHPDLEPGDYVTITVSDTGS